MLLKAFGNLKSLKIFHRSIHCNLRHQQDDPPLSNRNFDNHLVECYSVLKIQLAI
jgi:hypothetical protein